MTVLAFSFQDSVKVLLLSTVTALFLVFDGERKTRKVTNFTL